MIFHEYKAVQVHIPKTGGTSIRESLKGDGGKTQRLLQPTHSWPFQLHGLPAGYTRFTFVRNPWDRALSYYRWRSRLRARSDNLLGSRKEVARFRSGFRKFLGSVERTRADIDTFESREAYENELVARSRRGQGTDRLFSIAVLPQSDFIFNRGKLLVDFAGRFEALQQEFDELCLLIGAKPRQLEQLNRTLGEIDAGRHYSEFYDDDSREIVSRLYRNDIELFGYRFEHEGKAAS
jgi:hypothetical protein